MLWPLLGAFLIPPVLLVVLIVSGNPDRSTLYRQAGSVIGKYKADRSDISINHDGYLEEDLGT